MTGGHFLGEEDRAKLIALAIGATNFPEQKAGLPAILLYAILGAILTIPHVLWRKRVVR